MKTENIDKISGVMGAMEFSDVLLDAALLEINDALSSALGGKNPQYFLLDVEQNRYGAARAMALAGALVNLNLIDDVEQLMLGVGFLDEEDAFELKVVKGVMLDCLLTEKAEGLNSSENFGIRRVQTDAVKVLIKHGYADQYFSRRGTS